MGEHACRYSSQVQPRSFNRALGYSNPEFDALAADQLYTVDEEQRTEMVAEMQGIIAEDLPVLSLYVPTRQTFFDPDGFDAWYYTPGCPPCGASRNKHMYVTGQEAGLTE